MNNSDIYSISNLAIKDAWYDTDKNIVLYVRDIIKSFLEKYEYIKIKVKDKLQFSSSIHMISINFKKIYRD